MDFNGVVHQGVDVDTHEARVAARVAVERADAHQAVHAVFPFQHAKRKVPIKLHGDLLDARNFPVLKIKFLDLESVLVAVHPVHPHEHGRPIAAFGATGARRDLHHGVEAVFFCAEHVFELEFLDSRTRRFERFVHLRLLLFPGLHEFVEDRQVVHRGSTIVVGLNPTLFGPHALHDLLRRFGVVPKLWILCQLLIFRNLHALLLYPEVAFQFLHALAQGVDLVNRQHGTKVGCPRPPPKPNFTIPRPRRPVRIQRGPTPTTPCVAETRAASTIEPPDLDGPPAPIDGGAEEGRPFPATRPQECLESRRRPHVRKFPETSALLSL